MLCSGCTPDELLAGLLEGHSHFLEALWWIARIAVVVLVIEWFWWKGWYIALAIAVILTIAGVLALQARAIQRSSRRA